MPDLFIACAGGLACLLLPFGFAFLVTRDRFAAEEGQFPLPSDLTTGSHHVARPSASGR